MWVWERFWIFDHLNGITATDNEVHNMHTFNWIPLPADPGPPATCRWLHVVTLPSLLIQVYDTLLLFHPFLIWTKVNIGCLTESNETTNKISSVSNSTFLVNMYIKWTSLKLEIIKLIHRGCFHKDPIRSKPPQDSIISQNHTSWHDAHLSKTQIKSH